MAIDATKFKSYKLIEFDDDEVAICEIKKHYLGVFLIYLTGAAIALVVFFGCLTSSLWIENNNDVLISGINNKAWLVSAVGVVSAAVILVVSVIYAYIFKSSVILVTNEKVAQVLYKSLFNRKVSQLNISDVQDVTVSQTGIFARAFNYGTLVIETAGEQQNYTFTFAPKPHECAKDIIAAHEANVKQFGN